MYPVHAVIIAEVVSVFDNNINDLVFAELADVVFVNCAHDGSAAGGAFILDDPSCNGNSQSAVMLFNRAVPHISYLEHLAHSFDGTQGASYGKPPVCDINIGRGCKHQFFCKVISDDKKSYSVEGQHQYRDKHSHKEAYPDHCIFHILLY